MKQGVLLYALNNEQIDYVEIAYHAAKKAKQHLNLPVAIITDSADWLYEKFPNHREVFDMVIKIVSESDVKVWQSNRHYNVGNLVYHNGTIWRKVKEGNETINVVNKEYRKKLDTESFEPVYIGIEVDKWYPNLPYLAGQHVWYENILYRCHTSYEELDTFSLHQFDILIENVQDGDTNPDLYSGDIVLYDRVLWQCKVSRIEKEKIFVFDKNNFESIYSDIEVDKWYPNLPYLAGQHVWYENILYRCHTNYKEKDVFSKDNYEVLIDKVLDYELEPNYIKGDKLLYNRKLWLCNSSRSKRLIIPFDKTKFEPAYLGIEVDKWYSKLPYLKGQHVWHNNILYRCHTDYEEKDEFSIDKYDIIIEKVLDYETAIEIKGGDIVLHNRTLWVSHTDLKFILISELTKIVKKAKRLDKDFTKVYEGIEIDKWYPNLPYLKGQHVWFENTLYRCEIGYTEEEEFTKDKYSILLENIKDLDHTDQYSKGDILLSDRVLLQSNFNKIDLELVSVNYNLDDLERVYQGIDIDKWYPNLPYLAGQHVWYKDTLYRCHTDYEEKDEFSLDQYDILLENVKDLSVNDKFLKGDILLHDRVLWISKVNFDLNLNDEKIRDDIWEDTKERHVVYKTSNQYRKYFDGALSNKRLKFKNDIRIKSFELSPFDETLVIDCDYFINNDTLKYCWQQPHDFLIFKEAVDLSDYRYDPRLHTLSDKSIEFYWATVFFFRKTKNTEVFFTYLGHIQDNYNYYRYVYQIQSAMYRNDYAFSIAIHVMNGYQKGSWAQNLPGKLYYTIDKDILVEYVDDQMKFLVEKEKYRGEYTLLKSKGLNVHVMNKFSLARIFGEVQHV